MVFLSGLLAALPAATLAQQPAVSVTAQVDCDSLPVGPNRTDYYIGLSRINHQKSDIFAGVEQQKKNNARYRQVTGKHVNKKRR